MFGKSELKIQTTADLNGKRYNIMSAEGCMVRAGTFCGYSFEFIISTCGLNSGSYILTIEEEKINFVVDET